MPRDPRPLAPAPYGDFSTDRPRQTYSGCRPENLAFPAICAPFARFTGRPRGLSPLRRAAMKASRPLGGITYADTRPPACETCAHPRDRGSGGIVGAVASVTSLSGQRRAKILSDRRPESRIRGSRPVSHGQRNDIAGGTRRPLRYEPPRSEASRATRRTRARPRGLRRRRRRVGYGRQPQTTQTVSSSDLTRCPEHPIAHAGRATTADRGGCPSTSRCGPTPCSRTAKRTGG